MTEADWLACNDPLKLLDSLQGVASYRKLRLAAVACGVCLGQHLPEEHGWAAVRESERYADLLTNKRGLRAAQRAAWAACHEAHEAGRGAAAAALWVAAWVADWKVKRAAWQAISGVRQFMGLEIADTWLCQMLRDIFNPFRPVSPLSLSLLHWHDGIIPRMANAIYEERDLPSGLLDPARLAVLADALTDAGCEDAGLLGHLRSGGVHARGCFAVDAVLGKS
jgi:hypothetical protein